jgi:hypothetical protein
MEHMFEAALLRIHIRAELGAKLEVAKSRVVGMLCRSSRQIGTPSSSEDISCLRISQRVHAALRFGSDCGRLRDCGPAASHGRHGFANPVEGTAGKSAHNRVLHDLHRINVPGEDELGRDRPSPAGDATCGDRPAERADSAESEGADCRSSGGDAERHGGLEAALTTPIACPLASWL